METFKNKKMNHGPLISYVKAHDKSAYVFTGQSGLDDGEAYPSSGIVIVSTNLQEVLNTGDMQMPRSMHKQSCF